ncbi:molybdate ABC transporter substrate-binding protein [Rhodobacterales bacterium HKCCE3408]|nr:molybdate ABC transporter substrate-binding protein [Rhodobacterales bacterium HKCCE3408]
MRVLFCLLLSLAAAPGRAEPVTIFAAASLGGALDAVAEAWDGAPLTVSYAGSATLARQIAAGAPADIAILANADWMDFLESEGRVSERRILLTNSLVLVGPAGAAEPGDDLAAALAALPDDARIATGFVESVPAGIYAAEALRSAGLWDAWSGRLVQTENVRLALALAARGEVARAITYRTDALAEPRVEVEVEIPDATHAPIVYPAGLLTGADEEAVAVFAFLSSDTAQAIFAEYGFGAPE